MGSLILAIAPFITSALTGLFKKLPLFANLGASHVAAVRLLAAVIALVYTFFGFWISGTLNGDMLNVAINAVLVSIVPWLGSLGIFHAFFQKKEISTE